MLSQELRPSTWSEVAGQKENIKILKAVVKDPENAPKCLIFEGAYGSGKCVEENTRVFTSEGYLKIKDLVMEPVFDKEGFMDISKRNIRVKDYQKASHFYYGGLKDTIKISSSKFNIEGTPNHRVLVLGDSGMEWKYLSDMKVGDYIAMDITEDFLIDRVSVDIPFFKYNDDEFEKGYFLGSLLGDGYVVKHKDGNRIRFNGTKESCDRISNMFYDTKNLYTKLTKEDEKEDLYHLYIVSKELKDFLVEEGLEGNSENRTIPEWFFCTNRDFLSGVLTGIYDADGTAGVIDLGVISEGLAKGFKDILTMFGVVSSYSTTRIKDCMYTNGNKKNHRLHRVMVNGITNLKKCLNIFHFKKEYKWEALKSVIERMESYEESGRNNNREVIPRTKFFNQEVERLYQEVKSQLDEKNGRNWGWKEYHTNNPCFSLRKNSHQRAANKLSWKKLKNELVDKSRFESPIDDIIEKYEFVEVEKVEKSRSIVYDLTVPETHAFMANGIINHNTTSARILVKELNNIKDSSVKLEDTPFYYEFDSTVVGNVEEIRKMRDTFNFSYGDYWRVVVFDEAHSVSSAAQNALLKMLEEVTGKTIFVFCTTEVNKILPTIRSRSLELSFNPVPPEDIVKNLDGVSVKKGITISDEVKRLIADRSNGHMRNAHMLLDKYLLLGEQDFIDSVKSAVTLYCDYLIAIYNQDAEKVQLILNSLMNIPKDSLQADWNTVMTESLKSFCGFEVRHKDIKRLVDTYKSDFQIVSSCYMSTWIKNAFIDMPYFQATMLNLYLVIGSAVKKKNATPVPSANARPVGRYGAPVR